MISILFIAVALLIVVVNHTNAQYTTTILAGTGTPGSSGDNGPATSANVNYPLNCFVDSNSNTFFVDYNANVVRKINAAGIISRVGGTGSKGISNSGGAFTSVQLYSPRGLVGDSNYLYISDEYHIWKYNKATGIVAIMTGKSTKGISGNGGPATSAQVNMPTGLWVTTDGTLYIAEFGNQLVRKITTVNIISTAVGGGGQGFAGDGNPAASTNVKLYDPFGVYMDTSGVLFVADSTNNRIRYVINGILNTFAGGGPTGNTADGYVATRAALNSPSDVKGDSLGNIFMVESGNKVRVVNYNTKFVTTYLDSNSGLIIPNGIWLGIGTTNTACIGIAGYVLTAPFYVNPSTTPTTVPTLSPTKSPTTNPSVTPTANTTQVPSLVPTPSLTQAPTAFPTFTPSSIPSKLPTVIPSKFPTASPTTSPTATPTTAPTVIQTAIPTAVPSVIPSVISTVAPTMKPTTVPTDAPTFSPTALPTASPSLQPSFVPSANPTPFPSYFPTSAPSSMPSSLPTSSPSSVPSSTPTSIPTAPTFMPTAAPSFSPTAVNPDVVKVDATTRVKFVDGETLNDVSLTTLITAFQNISDNPQSTTIVSTTLVSQSSKIKNKEVKARFLLVIQGSFTYDIRFRNTYAMALHPGYNSSQLASLKVARIQQQIELGSFETTLRNLAVTNNATQLLNSTCNEVTEIGAVVVPPSSGSSSSSHGYSAGVVVAIVLGVVFGLLILSVVVYFGVNNNRLNKLKRNGQVPHHVVSEPGGVTHYYQDVLKL